MKAGRTKRLTLDRVLKILQLRFGTQVQTVNKKDNLYFVDDIQKTFTRADILGIEDKVYTMQDHKIIIHLNNGSIIKTNKIDYYNQGKLFGCTDKNGQRAMCGTKFIEEIEYL